MKAYIVTVVPASAACSSAKPKHLLVVAASKEDAKAEGAMLAGSTYRVAQARALKHYTFT